jgi:Flavin containing amine oxidoreductase.
MNGVSLDFFFEVFDPEDDIGVIAELLSCGWDEEDPIDFLFKLIYYDYEFANRDGSIFGWFDFAAQPILFTTDDWEKSIVAYAEEKDIEPVFETRVMHINYDLDDVKYKASVMAQDADGKCTTYAAQRVISTVAAGVYNHNLISFDPPLLYPDAEYNPMKMRNYVKIFYRFSTNFWDSGSHYIYPITSAGLESTNTGILWQDLSRSEIFPGSNILLLTLLEESFIAAVGEDNVKKEEIPHDVLLSLLDPLRITFQDSFVEPCDIFHSTFHSDPNFGFGSYSNWDVGYSPYEYFNFWGAYEFNQYIAPCDHNGCNKNNEWILFLSGTAMCLNEWEYVDGAWHGGEFTANLMLESLGLDIGEWEQFCYI